MIGPQPLLVIPAGASLRAFGDISRGVFVLLAVVALTTFIAWATTAVVRSHAIRNEMFDMPNQRSSHTLPTPRGGGAAIAAVVLLCTCIVAIAGWLPGPVAVALIGGGGLVAFIGWLDDRHNVNAGWRAIAHLCASSWVIAWLGGVEYVRLGHLGTISGPVGNILTVLAIAWMINLYNFMDGIDGLAAVEAMFVGAVGALMLLLSGAAGLLVISASIAGAAAGFLIWNRMPARIFMGDVGSGFLGFTLATVALAAYKTASMPVILWVLLLLVFIADSTITLLRRILRGEPWHTAHRLHAYQRSTQSGLTHAQVVARVALINLLLAVLAIVAFVRPNLAWPMLLLGVGVVAVVYIAVERRLGMWALPSQMDARTSSAGGVRRG